MLDHLLSELIEQGAEQIVELAAGLSPRGFRIGEKHAHHLHRNRPTWHGCKKSALLKSLKRPERHRATACNILADAGEDSISGILNSLDKTKTVIISEGLVNYFPLSMIRPVWANVMKELKAFPEAYYLTDLYPNSGTPALSLCKMTQKIGGAFHPW